MRQEDFMNESVIVIALKALAADDMHRDPITAAKITRTVSDLSIVINAKIIISLRKSG